MQDLVCINTTHTGSTGKIMRQIADSGRQNGISVITFSQKGGCFSVRNFRAENIKRLPHYDGHIYYGDLFSNSIHSIFAKITGYIGIFSFFATKAILKVIKNNNVNIIHLHNLHGFNINLPLLFRYIKKKNIKVVWTLHDCWAFTGHCPYFTLVKCDKWKTGCYKCPQYKEYPQSLFDNSKKMYKLKKKWFMGVKNMTLVTPSQWLADLVKQSFLKEYPVKVINNGIDLSVFKPSESNFREKYNIPKEKYILLGVAFGWGVRKGLDVFIELSKRLPENYQIVLVGTDDNTDKQLPQNIISIHRTQNQTELAEIYTAADLFVNPTREENYPTVNMESLACGTPIVTFKTGGSPEILDETCGSVVACDDIDALECEIKRICSEKPYSQDACLERAKHFDMNERFQEYIELYKNTSNA